MGCKERMIINKTDF